MVTIQIRQNLQLIKKQLDRIFTEIRYLCLFILGWPMNRNAHIFLVALSLIIPATTLAERHAEKQWLAGDHHIHSYFSVGWEPGDPPKPVQGGDAIYSIIKNAEMARQFGLDWMVATDHGGPNHSKINLEQAYPELKESRQKVPEVIQFMGLELNSPGADHTSIIIPHTHDEAHRLYEYESRFDTREPWPEDPDRNHEAHMLEALKFVDGYPEKPIVIAHHPSRSAPDIREYGMTAPAELRAWNDTAPEVAIGMEGAPGHQAAQLREAKPEDDIYPAWVYARGAYGRGYPTLGGFDQMTAVLGGFWDSMLGEGRRWWITANSDSHIHYTEGGIDFWPGEYSKTYVYAAKNHDDILEGIRHGRVFVTTGDLISSLNISVSSADQHATTGSELKIKPGQRVTIEIEVSDPDTNNHAGRNPSVERIDLITGSITGRQDNPSLDRHTSTTVTKRFSREDWTQTNDIIRVQHTLTPSEPIFLRIRGTNTGELEPSPDEAGEDPWDDLWFYSNPVFISIKD